MGKVVVASAQLQFQLFDAPEDYRKELERFLYMARAKRAELVVLPALSGVMCGAPLMSGLRVSLLKQAEQRRNGRPGIWRRTKSVLAGGAASVLGARFRTEYAQLLRLAGAEVASQYETVFAGLARTYEVTLVAGSALLPDSTGTIRHHSAVFGPDGTVLGGHDKIIMAAEDDGISSAGSDWTVVPTSFGRLGLMFGEEALFPESGRILAFRGAEILVTVAAVTSEALAASIRQAVIARTEDNQLFGLGSFLVGKNHLSPIDGGAGTFTGKSGIYAPLELTPRHSGILVEMGTTISEGLVTAQLDLDVLHELWASGVGRVRSSMPSALFARYLPGLYGAGKSLADVWPGDTIADSPDAGQLDSGHSPEGVPAGDVRQVTHEVSVGSEIAANPVAGDLATMENDAE